MEDNLLEFNNKKYKIKVDMYDDKTKSLKVEMFNIETNEQQEITAGGTELFVPPIPTPDCVIVDDKKEKLNKRLLEVGLLDYCNALFAKFNVPILYTYDKEGTRKFLDYHAKKLEYENDKGNSLQEVRENLIKDARETFKNEKVKKYFKKHEIKNKWDFMYSLIDEKDLKSSVVAMYNVDAELYCLVRPYYKHIEDKLEFVKEWEFNYDGGLFCLLEENFNIHKFDNKESSHLPIWYEIFALIPYNDNKKGINKYLNYCKQKRIPNKMLSEFSEKEIQKIMKLCKKEKDRER